MGKLDILVNNAGIQESTGKVEEINWEDLRKVIDVNLLAEPLRPDLFSWICNCKTGVVRATETIAKEVKLYGFRVNAIASGAMNTSMTAQIIAVDDRVGGKYEKSFKQKQSGGASMENAASLIAFLASEEAEGISGKLISAVWDDWKNLSAHKNEVKQSDVYTLSRIILEDRGFNWRQ